MRFIGIDYGAKRVGVAFSDEAGKMAFPDSVLETDQNLISVLKDKIIEKKVQGIVVGESCDLDGRENEVMAEIKTFANRLKKETNLSLHFEPEHFTSTEAGRVLGKNKMHDASAAALILQNFLERNNSKGTVVGVKTVAFDDFKKIEIRVGQILLAEKVEGSDKLVRLEVDFGEVGKKQIIAGIALHFADLQILIGKKYAFVYNLEPRKLKGLESQGMILAASVPKSETTPGAFSLLQVSADVTPGTIIS
jgi:methionine--tRNA ligase beta chain